MSISYDTPSLSVLFILVSLTQALTLSIYTHRAREQKKKDKKARKKAEKA